MDSFALIQQIPFSKFDRWSRARLLLGAITLLFLFDRGSNLYADSIRTIDGTVYRGTATIEEGGISVAETNGSSIRLSLSNLEAVVFANATEVIPGEQNLLAPWTSEDVGSVAAGGGARQQSNSFILQAAGTGLTPALDGFHFVFQSITGDGEIVARVKDLSSTSRRGQAALMIRQTLGPESAHAAVIFNEREAPVFQYRVSKKRPNPLLRGTKVTPPCWLKLERHGKFYIGSISADGHEWKVVGSQTITLAPTRNRDDQWYVGLGVSSSTNNALCTVHFDEVSIFSKGIKAEMFSDEFKTLTKAIVLPGFNPSGRSWADDRPVAIRWTGQWIPPYTEKYSFSIRGPEEARFWVNGIPVSSTTGSGQQTVALSKDTPVSFKLETRHNPSRRPAVNVSYSTSHRGSAAISEKDLLPYMIEGSAESRPAHVTGIDVGRAGFTSAGVLLKDGTLLAAAIKEVNEATVAFAQPGKTEETIPTRDVARLQFRSLSPQLARRIRSLGPGLLLASGDLIEGELKEVKNGRVTISSVIFGLRSYDVGTQAAAMVLRRATEQGRFLVRTSTGSAYWAGDIEFKANALMVLEPVLGRVKLPADELLDIRRLKSSDAGS